MTAAVPDMRELGRKVRNWGRWGADDERGTTNLITPERVRDAARLIRTGQIFELGIPLDGNGPQPGGSRINPIRLMSENGQEQVLPGGFKWADDYVFMPLQAGSQYDSLAHVHYDEQLYNGHPGDGVTVKGADKCGIHTQAKGIAGRGVLLDVARHRGLPWLESGTAITPEELDAVVEAQGVEVGPGDILLIRTGWHAKFLAESDSAAYMAGEPGLSLSCAQWLRDRDVAVVGADNWAVEVIPGENPGALFELHMVLIRDMGMTLAEMLDFEELSKACAADGVYDFFYTGPPLQFTRAVGSPINPLAIR
ncbi:cyclase family protein [Rhodococcus aetherivorans]|uniref:Probable polyketide cyclase n=1 Tax=Rhodococcus aetherivorans TaxID=191292 RepID=A0ABQ0YK78_9NOCA|nr:MULTISPECIES: cyclase family protein [Rhodococcus]ETT27214.1 cyclase family protein [Rhodococcus rhodochrous ATCC 21198]NGP26994.1 cyclase family protein [Rhodococcus aetherivorans]OLL18924.1 cyclase [Rhodococcus sp. M8]QPG47616.1 cyclase family protein [Rhodococcus sp. M8]GES36901.1 probable polyketide cyclase [Rhodococcus aetherivorans]